MSERERRYEELKRFRPDDFEGGKRGVVPQSVVRGGHVLSRRVPWQDAEGQPGPGGATVVRGTRVPIPDGAFSAPPIQKRTPQARLDDVTKTLVDFYNQHGFVPESILREIQGIYWMNGQNMSIDELRQVAGHYLRMAEAQARR